MVEDSTNRLWWLMLADVSEVCEDLFESLEVAGFDPAFDDPFL